MGMFDWLKCDYPLPIDGAPREGWQTKDTPAQMLDVYTIREDGSLWGQEYDFEDRSDPNAVGVARFVGCMTRVNIRDVPCNMTGEVCFYVDRGEGQQRSWLEFSAYFRDGKIQKLNLIEDEST